MFNLEDITNKTNKEHNIIYLFIPDHTFKLLIIGSSGSGKTNALLNKKILIKFICMQKI